MVSSWIESMMSVCQLKHCNEDGIFITEEEKLMDDKVA